MNILLYEKENFNYLHFLELQFLCFKLISLLAKEFDV
jgi:hypothetical protein